jgi:hypothetical protein
MDEMFSDFWDFFFLGRTASPISSLGLTVCCKWRYFSVAVVVRRDGGLSSAPALFRLGACKDGQ